MAPPHNAYGLTRKKRTIEGSSSQTLKDALPNYIVTFDQHQFASTDAEEKYDMNK